MIIGRIKSQTTPNYGIKSYDARNIDHQSHVQVIDENSVSESPRKETTKIQLSEVVQKESLKDEQKTNNKEIKNEYENSQDDELQKEQQPTTKIEKPKQIKVEQKQINNSCKAKAATIGTFYFVSE